MKPCKAGKRKCAECNRCKREKLFSYRKTICNKCYHESDAGRNARDSYLQRTYGISLDEYETLLGRQDGGCAVCGGQSGGKNLAVDHNHATGEVRGLLCKRHNSALARWVRNLQEAEAIASYYRYGAERVRVALGREVRVPE